MSFLSRLVNPFKHSVTRALLNKSPTLNALRGGRNGRNPLIKPSAKPVERPMMAKPAFDPTMAKPINRPPMMAKPIRDPSMPGNPVSPTEDVAVSTWQKPRSATLPGTVDGPTYDGSGINPQPGVTRDYVLDGQRPQQGARVPGGGLQRLRPRMAAALEETGGEDLYGARRRNPLMYR